MHTIKAHFEALDAMPVTSLFGAIGIYILWSPRANVRPSYMGEGKLLSRFATEHVGRFGNDVRGYAAIMTDGNERRRKADAEIVEMTLLHIGKEIDQEPAQNEAGGKTKGLWDLIEESHYTVRIKVSGFHPLRWKSPIKGFHEIKVTLNPKPGEGPIVAEYPWRRVT